MSTNEPPSYPGDQPDPHDSSGTSGLPKYGSVEPPAGYEPPPTAPPAGGGHVSPQEPYSATAAIGWGWRKFTENIGPIIAAVLVFIGVSIAFSFLASLAAGTNPFSTDANQEISAGYIVVNLLSSILSIALSAAFARAALDVADGGRFDFFGAFGRINLVHVVVVSILVSVLAVIGFVLLVLPGIAVIFFTWFATWAVVDGHGPIDGIKKSFSIIGRNFGSALLLAILSFLTILLGLVALCVGVLVAYPVVALAAAYSYRRFNGQPVAA